MSNGLAFFLLFLFASVYVIWQRMALKQMVSGKDVEDSWFDGVFFTGTIMTLAMILNAIPFLKGAGLEYEIGLYEERMLSDGTFARPEAPNLLWQQLEILGGTFSLIAIVWAAIRHQSVESVGRGRLGQLEVMAAVSQRLLRPFWLAALGIGSVFGVTAGAGLTDIVFHFELLFGPFLILAVELTFMWLAAKSLVRHFEARPSS